jgi:hypothetical protein
VWGLQSEILASLIFISCFGPVFPLGDPRDLRRAETILQRPLERKEYPIRGQAFQAEAFCHVPDFLDQKIVGLRYCSWSEA